MMVAFWMTVGVLICNYACSLVVSTSGLRFQALTKVQVQGHSNNDATSSIGKNFPCEGGQVPWSPLIRRGNKLSQAATLGSLILTTFLGNQGRAMADQPHITHKVQMYVKIANYTEESVGKNRPARGSGMIVMGLYGNDAPDCVNQFLSLLKGDGVNSPSFFNAQFIRVAPSTGLLEMDKVRGITTITIAGQEQYEFQGTLLTNIKPLLERNDISHTRSGLLTRKQLSATPEFSITTKAKPSEEEVREIDSFHTAFGEILEGQDVLDAITNIPRYTYQTATGYASNKKGIESEIADAWFMGQRKFFVNMGKNFGDTRAVNRVGTLLKRVNIKDTKLL